jgi:hypothetical protein
MMRISLYIRKDLSMARTDIFGNTYFTTSNEDVVRFLRSKMESVSKEDADIYEEIIERIERYVPDKTYPSNELSQDILRYCCEYFIELQKKYLKKKGKTGFIDNEFGVLGESLQYYIQQYNYVVKHSGEVECEDRNS